MRPSVVALGILGVIVGSFVSGYFDTFEIIVSIIVVLFIAGAGNAINDYYDYEIDKTNKPNRPIPSGKISRKNVLYISILLYLVGISLCSMLSIYCFGLAIFNTFISWLYSARIKTKYTFGNIIPSWLGASSILFGGLLTETVGLSVIAAASMAFFANTGREIAKDIEDMQGDEKGGKKTVPILFGEDVARVVIKIFVIVAILMTPLPFIFELLNSYYIIAVLICDVMFIYSFRFLKKNPAKAQKIMKIAMFIGVLSFLIGAL